MSQSLGITNNVMAVKTISTDDPCIALPSGKRTDELDTESLRKELLALPDPIAEGVTQTEGRLSMLEKLSRHVATRRTGTNPMSEHSSLVGRERWQHFELDWHRWVFEYAVCELRKESFSKFRIALSTTIHERLDAWMPTHRAN